MKRLSFRFCRRAFLILAILFPIVYLCGGLFFALAGAHGEQVFAEPVYTDEYVATDSVVLNKDYKISIGSINDLLSVNRDYKNFSFTFTYGNSNYTDISLFEYNGNYFFVFKGSIDLDVAVYYPSSGNYRELVPSPWIIYSFSTPVLNDFINFLDSYNIEYFLYVLTSVPSEYVPENNSAYTDFIFSQPFVNDNFITSLGRGVLDDTAFGFPPFRDMFNWFNDSVMHIESDDALGVFGLGYAYYALNVVAVYELVVLVMMVFLLPLRITDKFMGENL